MAVKIRLSRGGSKKRPFYRIVAASSDAPRDGKFLEKLGTYNPLLPQDHAQRLVLNEERIKYWLNTGAQATDRLHRLFGNVGIVEKRAIPNNPIQAAPGKKALDRVESRAKKEQKRQEALAAANAAPVVEEVVVAAEQTPAAE
jgi:small subunit ribosomal protein S16